jgi:hypothetical protein
LGGTTNWLGWDFGGFGSCCAGGAHEQTTPPGAERKVGGLPFDFRRLTMERLGQRAWNRADARLFTPKAFGWGYGINFYWIAHPVTYFKRRREA